VGKVGSGLGVVVGKMGPGIGVCGVVLDSLSGFQFVFGSLGSG